MSSLAREVVFGHTAGLKDVEDFTQALPSQAPGTTSPTFGRSSAPKLQTVGQVAGASWRGPAPVLDDERAHLLSHAFVPSDEEQPAELPQATSNAFSRKVRFGIRASWVVNWLLLFAKAAAFTLSLSYSVLASAVDSLVDLLSQVSQAILCPR